MKNLLDFDESIYDSDVHSQFEMSIALMNPVKWQSKNEKTETDITSLDCMDCRHSSFGYQLENTSFAVNPKNTSLVLIKSVHT